MQTLDDNMKIWKLIETSSVECIKLYQEENKKDPLEREYETRVDFWNRYIEATLAKIEFCCDRKKYLELKNNLIEEAKRVLEPIIKTLSKRKQFENVTFVIKIN